MGKTDKSDETIWAFDGQNYERWAKLFMARMMRKSLSHILLNDAYDPAKIADVEKRALVADQHLRVIGHLTPLLSDQLSNSSLMNGDNARTIWLRLQRAYSKYNLEFSMLARQRLDGLTFTNSYHL